MWNRWRGDDAVKRRAKRARQQFKALHLPDLKDLHLPDVRDIHLPELHAPDIDWGRGRLGSRAAALWPALFAAAGAGAAVWWWNQWARGQAEADAVTEQGAVRPEVEQSAEDRAGGAAGAAAPEAIMAHAPPPEPSGARKPKAMGDGALDKDVAATLDASLAVQGDATPPRTP